jgi:hypothetical protein
MILSSSSKRDAIIALGHRHVGELRRVMAFTIT